MKKKLLTLVGAVGIFSLSFVFSAFNEDQPSIKCGKSSSDHYCTAYGQFIFECANTTGSATCGSISPEKPKEEVAP